MSLKCYLIQYQRNYSSLNIDYLKSKFDIQDVKSVKKIVNNLILNDILLAKWDNDFLVFYGSEACDVRFKKTIHTLERDVKKITENNILLLEAAMKSES